MDSDTTKHWRMAYPISGGVDIEVEEPLVETPPVEVPPVETPPPPTPEQEAARLREENARLRGQVDVLTTRPPAPAAEPPKTAVDPIADEYDEIERDFAAGKFGEGERTVRLGRLGARAEFDRREREQQEQAIRERDESSRTASGETVAVYMQRRPGLRDPASDEFKRVMPALNAVATQYGWDVKDPRAQALALERTFGPLGGTPVDTREFERRRHPGGGGGGTFADDPPPNPTPKRRGEQIYDRLLAEYQQFYLQTRGSKEAAFKTLEHADEHQMRKQGRFR